MKKEYPYILILVVIIGVFGIACYTAYRAIPRINYASYYEESHPYDKEREKMHEELEEVYDDFEDGEISKEELEKEVNRIKDKYQSVKSNQDALKEEYNIKDDLDLDEVKMDKDDKRDIQLKNLYYRKNELEKQEDALDIEEDELEAKYFRGDISKSEFLKQMEDIEKREYLLELEEEKLEEDARKLGLKDFD